MSILYKRNSWTTEQVCWVWIGFPHSWILYQKLSFSPPVSQSCNNVGQFRNLGYRYEKSSVIGLFHGNIQNDVGLLAQISKPFSLIRFSLKKDKGPLKSLQFDWASVSNTLIQRKLEFLLNLKGLFSDFYADCGPVEVDFWHPTK